MKIKEGDKVRFLNDVGGGTVVKVIDKDTAVILNETGFEIPVLINELLPEPKITAYQTDSKPATPLAEKKSQDEKPFYTDSPDINIFLAFVPRDQKQKSDSDLDVFLINDSNYFVFYNYAIQKDDSYISITGQLEPNLKEKITTYSSNQINDTFNLALQFIWFDKRRYKLKEPFSGHFKIKATRFMKENAFTDNEFFDEAALIIPVFEELALQKAIENMEPLLIKNSIVQKDALPKKVKPENLNKDTKEVDLHIHEIIENDTGMSDADKLEYQLEIFHKELAAAIKENYKRIVFIHGIGKGSLRMKITKELQTKYKHYRFQDASFREYGYGATMVILRK